MAYYRQIHTKIWKDEWFLELEPLDKLLFIYLFSNESAGVSGLYTISLKVIAFETGLDRKQIQRALKRFQEDEKIWYDEGVVWVRKQQIYNATKSPTMLKAIQKEVKSVRDCAIKRLYCDYYHKNDTVSIPYTDGSDTVSKEREREREREKEEREKESKERKKESAPSAAPSVPTTIDSWKLLIKDAPNKPAELRKMIEHFFPTNILPTYSRIGGFAKKIGGYGRLAKEVWKHSADAIDGDVLAYIQTCLNNEKLDKKDNGKDGPGPAMRVEDLPPEAFGPAKGAITTQVGNRKFVGDKEVT